MRVLVTGGSGMIGRHLVRRLERAGIGVHALDRRPPDPVLCGRWSPELVSFSLLDVRDTEQVARAAADVDAVVHLAATSSVLDYVEAPDPSFRNTVDCTSSVVAAVRASRRCGKLVLASTAAVYEGRPPPYVETQEPTTLDAKAAAKVEGERAARTLQAETGKDVTVLRPFSVYSECEVDKGTRANVLSLLSWAVASGESPVVWGDGRQTRDFVHAEDAARAFELSLRAARGFSIFNICSGVETSFIDVLGLLERVWQRRVSGRFIPVQLPLYAQRLLGDPSGSEATLGFRTEISVEAGARRIRQRLLDADFAPRIAATSQRAWPAETAAE